MARNNPVTSRTLYILKHRYSSSFVGSAKGAITRNIQKAFRCQTREEALSLSLNCSDPSTWVVLAVTYSGNRGEVTSIVEVSSL